MLCIKIDAATRFNRFVLGINVQVLEENEVKILAVIEIKARHIRENFKTEVEQESLNDFFVKKRKFIRLPLITDGIC